MTIGDERELARRARGGDTDAFGLLVRRYQGQVFNVAYRLFGQRQAAEDASQEAFLRAFRAFDRFDVDRPLGPWLKRITVNLCLNWLESERVRAAVTAADLAYEEGDNVNLDHLPENRPTPEKQLVDGERSATIRAAILQLPPRYRAVVELRHFQDMRYDEIALALDRSVGNVKSDLFRARKMLAGLLKRTW